MLYCWNDPHDTILLCNHILQHGVGQWQLLAGHFPECPAAHVIAPLKWHALQLQQECRSPTVKRYSEWELCLLHLAHQLGAAQNEGKARVCKALSTWLPGRTAAAIKQAYAGCTDARVAQLLQQNGWPADMLGLLEVWPGPGPRYQAWTADRNKQLAAHILAQTEAGAAPLTPAASSAGWPASAAAAAAAAAAFGAAGAAALGAPAMQLQPAGIFQAWPLEAAAAAGGGETAVVPHPQGSGWLLQQQQASAAHPTAGLGPASFGCGLELPEGDPALRQALEQHLDSMLAGAVVGLPGFNKSGSYGFDQMASLITTPDVAGLHATSGADSAAVGPTNTAVGAWTGGAATPASAPASPAAAGAASTQAATAAALMGSGLQLGAELPLGRAGPASDAAGAVDGQQQGSRAVPGWLPGVVGHKRPWQQCTQLQQTPTGQGMSADSLAGRDTGPGPCSLLFSPAGAMAAARHAGSEPGQQLPPASTDSQLQQGQLAGSGGIPRRPVRGGVSADALSGRRATAAHLSGTSEGAVPQQLPAVCCGWAAAVGADSTPAGLDQQLSCSAAEPPVSSMAWGPGASPDALALTATAATACAAGEACRQQGSLHCQEHCSTCGPLQQQVEALQQRQLSVEAELASLRLLLHQLVPSHGS